MFLKFKLNTWVWLWMFITSLFRQHKFLSNSWTCFQSFPITVWLVHNYSTVFVDGDFVTNFWAWTDFSSYLIVTAAFTAISLVVTYALLDVVLYIEIIGFLALFLEANLGSPQFLSNWNRKSTLGMRSGCYQWKLLYVFIASLFLYIWL